MMCRDIIAACVKIDAQHINTLCVRIVEFFNAKPAGT